MVSFTTTASNGFLVSTHSLVVVDSSTFPSVLFVVNLETGRRRKLQERCVTLNLVAAKRGGPFSGFSDSKKSIYVRNSCRGRGGFVRRCKRDWESEGDLALEAEILEFMRNSKNPEAFPSKKQLVDSGRMDLVEGILKQAGWLSLGWDLDDEKEQQDGQENDDVSDWKWIMAKECDDGIVRQRVDSVQENSGLEGNEVGRFGIPSFSVNSSYSASSSLEGEDDSGIEGILSRLEKERNMNLGFGFDSREKRNSTRYQSNDGDEDDWRAGCKPDATVAGLERSSKPPSLSPSKGMINHFGDKLSQNRSLSDLDGLRNSFKPEMWRTWSIQMAGVSDKDFEAAEITLNQTRMGEQMTASKDKTFPVTEGANEPLDKRKEMNPYCEEIDQNQIRSRLQNLKLELSSVLHSFMSKADEVASQKVLENSNNSQELSDVWEFQENEIMNAQHRLRSIRAKLAVLEGKMALAIIDAQKMVEEKQMRIVDARRALQLLRTACIVWPNSASQVFLAGSFDGWATQRKMEKSSTGIFSVYLKLYAGRYEIKFIVDGEWRIDPLRPIVHNNGYENNLLII